ncbi:MAG: GumC family protein [Hyphomicrobiaceae bacterium]
MERRDIDIVSLGRGLWRSLPTLLALSLGAGLLTFAGLSLVKPQFTSVARLAITAKSTTPFPDADNGNAGLSGVPQRLERDAINTHINALRAPDLLLQVAKQLRLTRHAEFGAGGDDGALASVLRTVGLANAPQGLVNDEDVLKGLAKRLQVTAVNDNRFIAIRYAAQEPALAAKVANQIADTYRQNLIDVPVNEAQQVVDTLLPKIEQLNRELVEAEAAVERFRGQKDEVRVGDPATSAEAQRLAALNATLLKLEAARSLSESKWKTALDRSSRGLLDELPGVQGSPVIRRLIDRRTRAERKVAAAGSTLPPTHPRMKQLNSDLAGLKTSIRREVRKIVRGLEKEYRTAVFQVQDVQDEISRLKPKAVANSEDEARLNSLESGAKAKRAELERLQRQLEHNKTLVVTKSVPVEARTVSKARVSSVPTFPKKVPYTLLVMVAVMILGLAIVTAREIVVAGRPQRAARPTVGLAVAEPEGEDVNPVFEGEQPTASPAPPQWPRRADPVREVQVKTDDEADAITMTSNGIATHLLTRGEEVAGFRTIIVGERHGIDPADEGISLARELSKAGAQVIVIDWNLDHEGFSNVVGLANRPGITELLTGKATFEDIITNIPDSRIHHIGMGPGFERGEASYDGDDLNTVLDALDEAYDQILVIGRYNTAQTLFEAVEGRFDAGIVVCDSQSSRRPVDDAEDTFLGFEVTDIDIIRYERTEPSAFAARRSQIVGGQLESVA